MSRLPTPRNALDADSDGAASHPIAIQVIERAMRLLDALAAQPDPVTLKELSATTGLHASTAHRILNDLVVGRYVERVDNGLYQLGMRLLELGSLVKGRLNVREAAVSAMRSLHKLTGQTINLSVQQGDEIVYIERAWSERSGMQVVRAIGGRAPLHLTSTGKLFLSTGDTRQVRAYALRTGLAGHTRNSLTDLERLERELAWCVATVTRATTRNWSWACAASPPASSTIPASWWRGCRSRRRPSACRMNGSSRWWIPPPAFQRRWATSRRSRAVPMD